MVRHWISSAVALLTLAAAHAAAATPLTLGSGNTVEVLAVGPMQSIKGWSCLMLKYQTQVPLDDLANLRKEADEIWQRFVVDAERGKYECALISANEPPTGVIITHNKSYNFVYEKKDGSWRTLETRERAEAKLNTDFLKEFVERLDWLYEHHELNAALLYMANDWTVTGTTADATGPGPQIMNRVQFVQTTSAMFAHMTAHKHHREIVKITIFDGGALARVESRELETATVDGRDDSTSGQTIDTFELRGDVMLWTKSTTLIEKRTETRSD